MYLQEVEKSTLSQFDVLKVILLNGCKNKSLKRRDLLKLITNL